MSRHCVSVLLLVCIAQACLAFVPSWTATYRSSCTQSPASTPAAATSSLSQPSGATCLVFGTFGACGAHMMYPVRGITSLSALSEGNEEDGRGGRDTREAAGESPAADEIGAVQDEIRGVERKIEDVEKGTEEVVKKIDAVEAAIAGGSGYLGITDPEALLRKEEQLRRKEEQLRRKEEQLRRKEEQLREQLLLKEKRLPKNEQLRANNAPAVPKPLADFGAALTRAVVTDNTLELADGTFFLGEPDLRSKLYIRPCYEYLSELILEGVFDGTMKKIVVTGTPGIGKSEFGFYLMHLLRCRGKTVVLERKGAWYRFSDEGVTEGDISDFRKAGYLRGTNTWFLSDPKDRPEELLGLPTVVLVSPKTSRVNEFMKQVGSCRFFMPPWCLDELLGCQRAVFRHVSETDVRERFDKVGGVARAVFDAGKLEQVCFKMQMAAFNMDLNLLQQLLSRRLGDVDQVSTDRCGDALLHLFPIPETSLKEFSVDFASEFAHNVTLGELPGKEFAQLASFVRAAFTNDELGAKVVAERAAGFETIAHKTIGGAGKQQEFGMRILSSANNSAESVLEGNDLKLSFSQKEQSFEGNSFPDTLVTGTYYRPASTNFAAADSFGVDSGSKTLWFFQMKSAGLPPKEGKKAVKWKHVEEYWRSAKLLHRAPIKERCVYAFVVPEGKVWNKATKTSEEDSGCGDWLRNVTDGFKSACDVCVIKIPL